MEQRRRFKQKLTFFERCSEEAERLRKKPKSFRQAHRGKSSRVKAHQTEMAADTELWLRSPELKPPK
jgi:hypothetical protein